MRIRQIALAFHLVMGICTSVLEGGDGCDLAASLSQRAQSGDLFGSSVDIDSDLLLVSGNGIGPSGGAKLFDYAEPSAPSVIAELIPTGVSMAANAGFRATICGQWAILGAIFDHEDELPGAGSVIVFDIFDPANPIQIQRIVHNAPRINGYFGAVVDCHDGVLAIGTAAIDGDVTIMVFDDELQQFVTAQLLKSPKLGSYFGRHIQFTDRHLYVAAPREEEGALYRFEHEVDGSMLLDGVLASSELLGDYLPFVSDAFRGFSVSEDRLIFGVPEMVSSESQGGQAFIVDISRFDRPELVGTVFADDSQLWDGFGRVVEFANSVAVISALGADYGGEENVGAVYVFDISDVARLCLTDLMFGACTGCAMFADV